MNNPKEKQESTEQIAKERDLIDDGHQIIDKISHHAKTSIDDAVEGAEETLNKAGDDLVDAVRSKTDEVVNDAVVSMKNEAEKGIKLLKRKLAEFLKELFK